MEKIAKHLTDLIGNTPLLDLTSFAQRRGSKARIVAKLEYFNPAGSVKDRAALSMIEQAERSGDLRSNGVIIEPTSGNTGIGLALVTASRGYRLILTMPETMSLERRQLLSAYGAQIHLTAGAEGMSGAIRRAAALSSEIEGAVMHNPF